MADRNLATSKNLRVKWNYFTAAKFLFPLQKIKRKKGGKLTRHPHLSLSSTHIPASKSGGGPWLAPVHSFPASPCTSPLRRRAYLYPCPASPFLITSEAEHKKHHTPSSAPAPARDQQDQHVLLQRQLRVRRQLPVRPRMRRVGI
jgi:hypothetical protein